MAAPGRPAAVSATGRTRATAAPRYDAFISHASRDRAAADRIEALLGRERVWFDRSDIRLGALLGAELLANLRRSRVLVLLWSKHAAKSPWVQGEWIAAVSMRRRVVPVVLDKTPLPQALGNAIWLHLPSADAAALGELARSVKTARARDGAVPPSMRVPDAARDAAIDRLARAQLDLFDTWNLQGLAAARKVQRTLDRQAAALLARYPLDPGVSVLWAYQAKNGVVLEHAAELSAGVKVVDRQLDVARWRFLHALWLDPLNADALNGLGTIAWFDHDLDSAEFFVQAALRRAPGYAAAAHDLRLIRRQRRPAA